MYSNKVKPGLDFIAIGFLQFRFAGLANNDLKLCIQDDDEFGIFSDEFFKTGILEDWIDKFGLSFNSM